MRWDYWNYRVIKRQDQFGIHSVYYDEQGTVQGWDAEPNVPPGENLDDLRTELVCMLESLDQEIINAEEEVKAETPELSYSCEHVGQFLRRFPACCIALGHAPDTQKELLAVLWIILRSHFEQVEQSEALGRFNTGFSSYVPDFGIPCLALVIATLHISPGADITQLQSDLLATLPGFLAEASSTYRAALVLVNDPAGTISDSAQFAKSLLVGKIIDVVIITNVDYALLAKV